MIYDQADMVARRLLGQKIGEIAYYEHAETAEDIRGFLHGQGRIIITAPRRTGKTSELLLFAESKNPWGQFIVVCPNKTMQDNIVRKHREIFHAGNVAKRLSGGKIESTEVNPPTIFTPGNIKYMRGQNKPIYVDEFNGFPEEMKREILDMHYFVAAVTSSRV